MEALNEYIHWYNTKRIKMTLGGLSPMEYRQSLNMAA
ncbi:MAG: IS3 family transposase [Coriobacteriia bacterium]|nr:IS3 family transposase [Coriobacteriia bacterium]